MKGKAGLIMKVCPDALNLTVLTNKKYAMKKLLNIFSAIALMLVILGGIFKLNHWPGTGLAIILSMGFTTLLFLPLLLIVKTKEAVGWKRKIVTGFGIFCLMLLMGGVLFKIMHWPFAGPMLVLSMGFAALFVFPGLGFGKAGSRREKTMYITGYLSLSFFALGILGKIMHWPGPPLLFIVGTVLMLRAIICFSGLYKEDKEKKNNMAVRFAIAGVIISTLVTLSINNTSNALINAFGIVEKGILDSKDNLDDKTEDNYKFVGSNKDNKAFMNKAAKLKELSDDLHHYIAEMKSELISRCDGVPREIADSMSTNDIMNKDNFDVPTLLLIGDAENLREGIFSARELRNKLIVFRKDALGLLDADNAKVLEKEIGLKTDDSYSYNIQQKVSWELDKFYHVPLAADICLLSQLQYDVRYAESAILRQLSLLHNVQLVSGVVVDVN
jgi:hypothetical protein